MEWLFSVARLFYDHHDRNRMLQSTIDNLTENLLLPKELSITGLVMKCISLLFSTQGIID